MIVVEAPYIHSQYGEECGSSSLQMGGIRSGPPRKYYELSEKGEKVLDELEKAGNNSPKPLGKYLNIQMNKTIQINLAGRSLQIDESAFSTLQDYLERGFSLH